MFDLRVEDFVIGENGAVDAGLTRSETFFLFLHRVFFYRADLIDFGDGSVAVSPDGRYVAAGSLDAVVRIWDAQTGVQLGRFIGHSDSVYSVAFAPDGSVRSRSLFFSKHS